MRENLPYPKSIADAPDLDFGNAFFYVAFNELLTCRLVEGGEIPWTAIQLYANENDIVGEQREMLFETIRELGNWYLDFMAKKSDKKAKNKPKPKANKNGTKPA